MRHLIQLKTHPFRLLLYLEWILLGLAVVSDLPWDGIPYVGTLVSTPSILSKLVPFSSLLMIVCIIIFGLLGLRLPTGKIINKILYIALELGIIWLADTLGAWQTQFLFLHLVVVIRSYLIFPPKKRLIVVGIVFLSYFLMLLVSSQDISFVQQYLQQGKHLIPEQIRFLTLFQAVNNTILFGLVLVFVLLLMNALLAERQSRQQLIVVHEQLRRYALLIQDQATLQERNRLAREIHDSLGHALTAQSIQLENALLFCQSNPDKTQAFLTQARELGTTALMEIRQSVSVLRQPLQGQSLESAIATVMQTFYSMTNIKPDYIIYLAYPVTMEISTAIYRIVQEALTNISKHSIATEVTLKLQTNDRSIHLLIEDNGQGFNPEQNTTGFGLQGMRERTLALGGDFNLVSRIRAGCRITVDIPLMILR